MKTIKKVTSECEHCKHKVLFENERFKLEQTPTGKQWTIYKGQLHSAVTEYREWMQQKEKDYGSIKVELSDTDTSE